VKSFRIIAYVACVGILFATAVNSIYSAVYIFPLQQRVMMQELQKPNNPPMPGNMNALVTGGMVGGLLLVVAVHLAFCVTIAILLSVQSARAAFAGNLPEPDDDPYTIRRRPRRDDDDDYDDDYESPKNPRSPGDTGITDKGE
jgi:hypothetical protein